VVLLTGQEVGMTDRGLILARLAGLAARNAGNANLAVRLASACQTILGADGAAISVDNTSEHRTTLCATDPTAARLEDLQDVTGEGPSWDAFSQAQLVVADLGGDHDGRWPEFSRSALHAVGQLTLYAFPMRPAMQTFGVICVYLRDRRSLPETHDTAQFVADAVGAALLRDPLPDGNGPDDTPWDARARVHQATGMVIVQLRIPPADALAILRAHAYATDRELAEVAQLVIDRKLDFARDGHDD
jgi:hypothetical protein